MTAPELKSRMEVLDQKIKHVEARLKLKGLLSADHQVTSAELRERFEVLSQKVQTEIANEEAHGHHVSALEASVRQYIDSLEIDVD